MRQDKPAKAGENGLAVALDAMAGAGASASTAPRLSSPPPLPGAVTTMMPAPAGNLSSLSAALAAVPVADAVSSVEEPAKVEAADPVAAGRRPAKRRAAGPARGAIAANDDIPTIGALIYALEQKPSRRPFQIATYATAGWVAVGLGFIWVMLASEFGKVPLLEIITRPAMMMLAASLVLPIAIFWFLALLVWRAQELKLMSSAMTEVAVRLAEPDRNAEQAVASLGQTVRKQVGFMNDAVAQAINRAGELEAMVHSEVTTLERSFQDNENRIRAVLGELASERTQLVSTSTDVHSTLKAMGQEVPALIERLSEQQAKLARIIEGAGQNLLSLEGALLKASDKFEGSLGTLSDKVQTNLLASVEQIEGSINERSTHLQKVLDEYTVAINTALGQRSEQMQTVFEDYTKALDATLVERTRVLDGAFSERVRLFDDSLMRTTVAIDGVVGEKAIALSTAMDSHARQLADALGRQSSTIDEALMHGIDSVRRSSENITRQSVKAIEGLSGQADMLRNVSENLLSQIGGVTGRFEQQGQSIMRAANALETANFRIDTTLQQRHRELGETLDKLTGKAGEIDQAMQSYSSHLEGSLTAAETRARSLTSDLARNAQAHAQSTIADIERMRLETEAQAARTLTDMHSQFSSLGREMTTQMGSLSQRLGETSDDLRSKAQRAHADLVAEQERLRLEAERIPQQTRESADAMRRALNDQLRALDQLSSLSSREAARRDVTPPVPGPTSGGIPRVQTPAQLPAPLANAWSQQQSRQPLSSPSVPALPPTSAPAQVAAGGWSLNDLLARASTEPAPPPAPVAVASPAVAAALDLAAMSNALDIETVSAAWPRVKAGQRGVIVRNMYSTEGRVTYDEVVRRYMSEPGFRGTVDKFLADFELVLRDSDARDPSGQSTFDHVVAAGGRTYLFLAHAAGRLG